jgi:DNA-binding response OmpR family regulator
MTKSLVVLIERNRRSEVASGRGQAAGFAEHLRKRYEVVSVPSGKQALQVGLARTPDVIILDAISLKTTGERIARSLKEALPRVPLIHLVQDPPADMDSPAEIVLKDEFTWRKLINAIERLLQTPSDDQLLSCGPFVMDMARRVLIANGQEYPLTPKLALLVEMFFRHPGQVLDRKTLMNTVWQTDYLGDTRTLDVHVRWIRRYIEVDAGHPTYLKTVRGVGYRLEIAGEEKLKEKALQDADAGDTKVEEAQRMLTSAR